eukprot:5993096-Prymnesium_polylepis.1
MTPRPRRTACWLALFVSAAIAPLRGFGGLLHGQPSSAGVAAEARVQAAIAESPLVVFGSASCPFCHRAVTELSAAGLQPAVHNIDVAERAALRERTAQRTIPYVFARGTFLGGCNDGPEEWMGALKLLRSGALQKMLDN